MDDIRCLTTMLSGTPMRICGQISKNGMKRSKAESQGAHSLLYKHGEIQNVDSCLEPVSYTHLDVYKRQVVYYPQVNEQAEAFASACFSKIVDSFPC